MTEPAFDTLAYFNNLRHAGVPEGQAQAQTEAMVLVASNLATKNDIYTLEKNINKEISKLERLIYATIIPLYIGIAVALFSYVTDYIQHNNMITTNSSINTTSNTSVTPSKSAVDNHSHK